VASAGKSIAAKIAMIAITTSNSIRVKATRLDTHGTLALGLPPDQRPRQ